MKKAIFIDRDGTIIAEPADEQVDSLEKLSFVPGAIGGLRALTGLGFELVMVTNQDGLGTPSFPEKDFLPPHEKMLQTLAGEGVVFDDILIDRSFPHENLPTRKPGTGMLGKYLDGSYDLGASFVIGDRETDLQLAAALGAKGILIGAKKGWAAAVEQIRSSERHATVVRKTRETDITLELDLDGKGASQVDSGVKFLDHMLDQLVHHGGISLQLRCKGDLEVDEHHSIEDIAICLGEALKQALGDKRGVTASACRWTRAVRRCCWTSAAGRNWSGTSTLPANTSAICPRKCSSTSSSRFPSPPPAISVLKPAARTTTTSPRRSSRPSPAH